MSRRRHKHTPTNPCPPQLPGGLWSWIKNHLAAIFGHRLCDNILKFVGILLSAAGLFGLGAWYNKSSSSSGSNSPSISGDNNNVTILCNAHSAEEIAKAISISMGKASVTDVVASCERLAEKSIPQLLNTTQLDYLANTAFAAWKRMDFSNAVMNALCANSLIASHFPQDGSVTSIYIESNVWRNVQRICPILIDDAMSRADYDEMSHMADLLIASTPEYWAYPHAMKDIARLRKSGGRLFFFSSKRVRELRKMPKRHLEQYLALLTSRGYLAPYSLNYRCKDVDPVEWGEFFNLGHALPYLDAFHIRSKDAKGNEITSNELYGQWTGLGKYELIDVNAEAARAMGLSESQIPQKPIRIRGTITHGPPRAIALVRNRQEREKIPEPSSGMLVTIGLAVLALRRRKCPASRPPRPARGASRAGARTYFLPRQKGRRRGPGGGKTARIPIKQGIWGFSAPQKPGKTFFKNFSKPYCAQRHDVILLRRLKDQIRFTEGL